MKTLCNEPQKRVNDLYQLLQFAMRPKRSYTTVGIGGFDSFCLHLSTSTVVLSLFIDLRDTFGAVDYVTSLFSDCRRILRGVLPYRGCRRWKIIWRLRKQMILD